MALTSPSTLSGATLGERHRCLNSAVSRAAAAVRGQLSFADLERLPEQTPVDRLFKIELAIKLNNVDYVLNNVKHEDMLYVSRALKCKWLVERRDVINPQYLEHVLFPEMVMPAISKMKHWLYTNLTDPLACLQFYQYYKTSKFDFAVKFLRHCDNEFLESEFPKILVQITPHYLKVLAEKCPRLVKVYYDALATDNELIKRYLKDEQIFYNSIKCILKSEPEIFLDITEKYHSLSSYNKLSPSATDYIFRNHKSRVMAKVELYVAYLLHVPTVAQRLSVEECQEVVVKLARADYLSWWFSYANVEPMIKRVSRADRAAFKKRVFVEKDVGERVTECPYALPASPMLASPSFGEPHVFEDQEFEPIQNHPIYFGACKMEMMSRCMAYGQMKRCFVKSELQKLFDEFRFVGFEGTLHELRGRVSAASSADRRRDMLLVLVSKSGGHADNVSALLQLAMRLRNEPVHERAAVVRSLVKRASAWRLPQHVWDTMLEYGHGLGLDGAKPEAVCREGLHAVVLRQLLAAGDCEPILRTAFLENFSTLTEYKLTFCERPTVAAGLERILITAAADAEPYTSASYLESLLNVLNEYRVSFDSAMSAIVALTKRSPEAAKLLLNRLYNARVGRRQLLRQYLEIRRDDKALVNALRHVPDALNIVWFIKLLVDGETLANVFFMKLAIYFNEAGGLAERVRVILQDKIAQEPHVKLARPLMMLCGSSNIESMWRAQDVAGGGRYKLAAALRANMHRARPAPDALALGWHEAGMKAVAWRAMRCPSAQVTRLVQKLLEERVKRTMRLALALARRTTCLVDVFSTAATIRPLAALRAAVLYYRKLGETADPRIWEIVKPHLWTVDLIHREGLRRALRNGEDIPNIIKPEYSAMLYLALDKISDRFAVCARRELMKCLPEVRDDLLETVLLRVLKNIDKDCPESYPAIVIRYMMLSKSDDEESSRYKNIGEPFLRKIEVFRDRDDESLKYFFKGNLEQLMKTLQYNYVFLDNKYQCCLAVIERILTWMHKILPKDSYFEQYVQIHATMLYFRAVRQSMKQRPEVFQDPTKKMSEGVDVVGFTFGRYVVKEVAQLKCQYFESVIELYREGFSSYLSNYFVYGPSRAQFLSAVVKGMLSEGVNSEARLAVHVIDGCQYVLKSDVLKEIKEQISKYENAEVQFFAHAEIFT